MCGRGRFSTLANERLHRYVATNSTSEQSKRRRTTKAGNFEASNNSSSSAITNATTTTNNPTMENISPGMSCPILVHDQNNVTVQPMIWGLIPHYLPKEEKPNHYQLFNKRIESFESSNKYYYQLVQKKRAVVIFDGFYEWRVVAGKKQPFYIHLPDEPLQLAAIYEDSFFTNKDGILCASRTFSIVTCDPSPQFKAIYDRQPVFLTDTQVQLWIDPTTPVEMLLSMVKENITKSELYINEQIRYHPVHRKMTDASYQGDDCHMAISLGGNIETFFASNKAIPTPNDIRSPEKVLRNSQISPIKTVPHSSVNEVIDLSNDDDNDVDDNENNTLKQVLSATNTVMKEVSVAVASPSKAKFVKASSALSPVKKSSVSDISRYFTKPPTSS